MVLDRIQFINDVFMNEELNKKMTLVRDNFINVMSCYNIALSYNANNVKIIDHSDDYNTIKLEISTNKAIVKQVTDTLKSMEPYGGLQFSVYQETFCASLVDQNEDGSSFTVKIYKMFI